jgi:hypothetical protein
MSSSSSPEDTSVRNFVVDRSDKTLQEIVSKLKFISKIQPHQKIDVKTMTFNDNSWNQRLVRTWNGILYGEDRKETYRMIENVMNDAYETCLNYRNRQDCFYRNLSVMILEALNESIKGIHNLEKTYETDVMFVSQLETLCCTLEAKIKLFK